MTAPPPPPPPPPLLRILYVSRRTGAAADRDVKDILAAAGRNNPAIGVTGALLADGASFGQVLEGPAPAVEALFERIQLDHRHDAVKLLLAAPAASRLFPDMSCAWRGAQDPRGRACPDEARALLHTLEAALARQAATATA